ncbi:anthranilate synthase component I [Alkalicoccus daliensis]|uniref:Anthranilate synthase component 1 n=1 Tax=Alkalicoccus daliensis TaxID=745820 RepID=A0A1H0AV08_9BACI|nr:anthranilate synthase component I [Alkalicoccus daliensis]SDN37272.1 anthranilate synthase, component I [Alkalicoccus daliensis]
MHSFSKQQFIDQAAQYKTVALSTTVIADTKTPIQLFQLFDKQAAFLLESKDPVSPWSNYSFIGLNPTLYLRDEEKQFVLRDAKDNLLWQEQNLQTAWERVMNGFQISPDLPDLPFPGGAVGYLGFEGFRFYEPRIGGEAEGIHDANFMFCETILAFHHKEEILTLVHFQETSAGPEASYEAAKKKLTNITEAIEKGASVKFPLLPADEKLKEEDIFEGVTSNYTKASFEADVNKIKDYIAQGDVFQTVLSQRFEIPVKSDGLSLYRVLRKVNPSPYLYYIRFKDQEIIGSSPERLVKADDTRKLEIHPIAGTRKRGSSKAEDDALAADLLADEKERAEHLMLVDLARNDIGRVSEYGSVEVHDLMDVSYFSHVMHLTTKVTGLRKPDVHPFETLFSTHPAGTVSGAPKVRAVEIIQELEQSHRGVYAGAIAYYGFNRAIDSCIAIRTMILKNGTAYVQAGAGVVQDSVPELEWEETRNKAKALIYAVKIAEQRTAKEEVMSHDIANSHER